MNSLYLKEKYFKNINLYIPSYNIEDGELFRLYTTAEQNKLYSVTVPFEKTSAVWNALDMSGVKINSVVNNFMGNLTLEQVYQSVKNSYKQGADSVEIIMPVKLFNFFTTRIGVTKNKQPQPTGEFNEFLSAMTEIRNSRTKEMKLVIETAFLKNTYKLQFFVNLFDNARIDTIKTASGFYNSNSTITDFYVMLKEGINKNIKIDFCIDNKDEFIIKNTFRLYDKITEENAIETNNKKPKIITSISLETFKKSIE